MVRRIVGVVHAEGLPGLDRFVANYALGILAANKNGTGEEGRPRLGIELPPNYEELAAGRPGGKNAAFWIKVAEMLKAGGAEVVCIDPLVAYLGVASPPPVSGIARMLYMTGMWIDQFTTHKRDKALMKGASELEISLMGEQHAKWAKLKDPAAHLTLIEPPKELTTASYKIQGIVAHCLGSVSGVRPDELVVVNF